MPDKSQKVRENAPGRFYVDATCIDCDLCRETAPGSFVRQDKARHSYVTRQPDGPGEPPVRRWVAAKPGVPGQPPAGVATRLAKRGQTSGLGRDPAQRDWPALIGDQIQIPNGEQARRRLTGGAVRLGPPLLFVI